MADSFTLPLRPFSEKRDRRDSLPVEIAQINTQYGSFRDVNEASLHAQIQADREKQDTISDDDDDADGSTADLDPTERREQLYKRRAEITQFAMQAHMETLFALDFVSLLLSKHAPRQAETSMSAYLKTVAPLGSLSAENVTTPPKPETVVRDTKMVSQGWRLQSFESAANKLLKSATRLEAEVASETRYWSEVLAVKDKGWKVCRLPREQQALGVQYGFLEATPIFRDRGLASLRRADDGSLILDKGLMPTKARAVRVRVTKGGRPTGCSQISRPLSEQSIESRILQARDTLYEEELFHELIREARVMTRQGVTTRQNLIQFAVSDEQEIMLDLIDADQDSSPDGAEDGSHEQDGLADAVAHSIRILLAYAHRQNLRRRRQIPPPLTPKRRHTPEHQLLRPIIAYLQHSSHMRWLESFLQDVYRVLQSAGISRPYAAAPFSSVNLVRQRDSVPPVEALVEGFLLPLESTFSGSLVNPQSSFTVKVRTNLAPPLLGTQFDVSVNLPHYPDLQPPARVGLQDEAGAVITHLILLDLVSAIASYRPKPTNGGGSEGTGDSTAWEAAYPHHGELLTGSPTATGPSKKMKVIVSREELTLQAYHLGGVDGFGRPEARETGTMQTRTWRGDAPESTYSSSSPTMMDFVADTLKTEAESSH